MISPRDALASITEAAFKEGQVAAEVVWHYVPAPIEPAWLETVQDNVVHAVVRPYAQNPHFAQLHDFLNAIRGSAWSGFESRWKDLGKDGPRPLDRAYFEDMRELGSLTPEDFPSLPER